MDGVQTLETFAYCYACHRVNPYDGYGAGMCIDRDRHSRSSRGWDEIKDAKKNMKKDSAELTGFYGYKEGVAIKDEPVSPRFK